MIGGVSNGHFPQGGRQLASPTDTAHCPITDCGLGGGRFTRIRQKPESRKASTLRCFTLWLRWRFLTELLITITQAIVVAKSTIPTTSGSDGRLRYGYTLPQHHPHHRPEHPSYGMPPPRYLSTCTPLYIRFARFSGGLVFLLTKAFGRRTGLLSVQN